MNLYLAGDIVDGSALRKSWQWEPLYNELLRTVLCKAIEGTRVVYTPGERDAGVYRLPGRKLGRIALQPYAMHTTAHGRQLLVVHGEAFDGAIQHALWTDLLGAWSQPWAVRLERWRRGVGLGEYAAAAGRSGRFSARQVAAFEQAVGREARRWSSI